MTDKEKLIDAIEHHIKAIDNHIDYSLEHMTSYISQLNKDSYRSHNDRVIYKDICAVSIAIMECINERYGLLFALDGLKGEKNENND